MAALVEAYNTGIYPPGIFPLMFEVRNDRASRLATLFRIPLLIPWYILNLGVQVVLFVVAPLAWLIVVITGRYPRPLFALSSSLLRWTANYFAYYFLLTDKYALFGFSPDPGSPIAFDVAYPERSSRMVALFRLILMIPGVFVIAALYIVALLLLPIYWLIILVSGQRPQWFFNVEEGTGRWYIRFLAYGLLLRDEYPPYSMDPIAPVESNGKAFIKGILLIGAFLSVINQLAGGGGGSDDDWWPEVSTPKPEEIAEDPV